jgi:hypothetical protein
LRRAQKSLGSSPRTEKDAERGWRTAGSESLQPRASKRLDLLFIVNLPDSNPAFLRLRKNRLAVRQVGQRMPRGNSELRVQNPAAIAFKGAALESKLPQKLDQNFVFGQDASQTKKRFNPFGLKRIL